MEPEVETGDDVLASIAKVKTSQAVIDEFQNSVYQSSTDVLLFRDQLLRKKAQRLVSAGKISEAARVRSELLVVNEELSMLHLRLRAATATAAEHKSKNPFSSSTETKAPAPPRTRLRRIVRDPGPFTQFAERWPAFMEMIATARRDVPIEATQSPESTQ